jgi:hypothetical protein
MSLAKKLCDELRKPSFRTEKELYPMPKDEIMKDENLSILFVDYKIMSEELGKEIKYDISVNDLISECQILHKDFSKIDFLTKDVFKAASKSFSNKLNNL